jgi:hypothetical protein
VLALGWRHLRPLPLLTGGAIWAGLSAYYLLAALLPEWGLIQASVHGSVLVDASSLRFAIAQALHTAYQVAAPQMDPLLQPVSGLESALTVLEGAVYVTGIGYGLVRLIGARRNGKTVESAALAVWFVWLLIPIAAYVRHQDIVTPRHLTLTLPLPALFAGILLDRLWPRFGAPLLAVLGANGLGVASVFFTAIPTCATNNVYALPYQPTFDLAGSVERAVGDSHAQGVYVLGRPSLAPVLASILGRDGLDAHWVDTSQSASLAIPPDHSRPVAYVTLDDDSATVRTLDSSPGVRQIMRQPVACEDMIFRSYVADPAALEAILPQLLPAELGLGTPGGLALDRLAVDRRLTPGATSVVGISWSQAAGQPSTSATLFLHLLDDNGRQVAGSDVALSGTGGENVIWQGLDVPSTLPPGRYSLDLGVYDDHGTRLLLSDGAGRAVGDDVVWGPLIAPPPAGQSDGLTATAITFGSQIELTGYRAGSDGVTLRWQALTVPAADYTVFVHALDANGQIVAQADGQPRGGGFPTRAWLAGDTVLDEHHWSLGPGTYTVEVGLYELATLRRLPGGPLQVALTVP